METPEKLGSIEKEPYPYDAIIVLGGQLYKKGEKYYPTDYRHEDQFGMIGAGMRMAAALELYFQKKAKNFVFSGGISEKNKVTHGPDVPTEAEVYKDKFLRSLAGLKQRKDFEKKFENIEEPEIILEDKAANTVGNIKGVLQIVQDKGWKKVAIVSSDYHIPRIKALYQQALEKLGGMSVDISFLSAENIAKEIAPEKYDDTIARAYRSSGAKTRLDSEAKGLADLKSGKYVMGEFQLENKKPILDSPKT